MEKKVTKCWSNVAKFDVQDKRKNANNLDFKSLAFLSVVPPGIEPGTQGFSVLCSTNWAMAPLFLDESGCKGTAFFWTDQIFWRFFYKNIDLLPKKCENIRKKY